jgi:hypothetical protein
MPYSDLQSKKSLLLWDEILYFEISNDQSKLLNNFLHVKIFLTIIKSKLFDQLFNILGLTNEDVILHLLDLKSQK